MLHIFIALLLSSTILLPQAITSVDQENIYHQIIPLLTKKINIKNPTQQEQTLLNGATAFLQHGTNHNTIAPETIQTITSVDFYTNILPLHLATVTISGAIQTALITTQLTDDISVLHQRQALIQYLCEHSEISLQLQQLLAQAVSAETRFFTLFQPIKPESTEAHAQVEKKLYFTSETFKQWNNNQYVLGGMKRAGLLKITLPFIQFLPQVAMSIAETKKISFMAAAWFSIVNSPKLVPFIVSNWDNFPTTAKICLITLPIVMGAEFYQFGTDLKCDLDLIHDKQKILLDIAQLICSLRKMNALLQKHSELQLLLPTQYQKIHELFDTQSTTTSLELKDLIQLLSSPSFQGADSYLLSKQGKILATYYKLYQHKGELIPYLEMFGTVDAFLTAAKLYEKYQNHPRVSFCLPTFVDVPAPTLGALEFWHPLINPDIVVTNDVIMNNQNVRNMIVTGPNAGGKTTSLMALVINIIFAQSFGIAPSKALTITPFTKIHSYLDITTNLQEGLSFFAAEVDRAKKLKQSIISCTPGQKTFTIIDEIFSGTDPKVASDIGFKFAAQLGEIEHSMTIITTHFPKLTDIEKEVGSFTNYMVADATIMPDGHIVYPFKLIPGFSTQNIAQHMLEQQGII